MIPAVFSPYADRTPKLRRVSLGSMLHSSCVWLGLGNPRQPRRVRSMQEGVVDEEVAAPASLRTAHAARNGASADVFYPALTLKRGAASRREAARRIRRPP